MNRARMLGEMVRSPLDLLVIGGGITGAGIALDAVSRGLRVGLVEKNDFSSGTSSKSSKLIHGGLRYLRQLQFKVTLEASREKRLLQKLAPHLVQDTEFLFPLYSAAERAMVGAGLWIYDLAAGLPKGLIHRRLGSREALGRLPGLDAERLEGAYIYHDARADDCRLVLHVIKRAADLGALVANRVEAKGLVREGRVLTGAELFDALEARLLTVRARRILNATGVWCDEVRALDDTKRPRWVRPSKGVHLVVPRKRIGNREAAILQSPRDGRVIFLVPWGGHTIIGTTDTDYSGRLDHPRAGPEDRKYLVDLVNEHLPECRLAESDIQSAYAGLRPLLLDESEAPSKASREHEILESSSGLLSITGGKLTTYRRMAKEVVDRVAPGTRSMTHRIPLFAATQRPEGLPDDMAEHLLGSYGSEASGVAALPGSDRRLVDGLPYSEAEVAHAVRREMAVSVGDVLARRLRLALFDSRQGRDVAETVAGRMGELLGWDAAERRRQIAAYEEELADWSA